MLHPMSNSGSLCGHNLRIWTLLIVLTFVTFADGFRCKWSNEGCDYDAECCSNRCELPHPGTNRRCTQSALYGPCIFHYQCADSLECSRKRYQCCSPYWGSCMNRTDCCNWNHLCVPAEGFTYRRCLYKQVTGSAEAIETSWAVAGVSVFLSQLISLFTLNATFSLPYNVTRTSRPGR